MRPVRGKTPVRTPASKSSRLARFGHEPSASEEVSVFCRVRPLDANTSASDTSSSSAASETDPKCVQVPDSETVQLVPPSSSRYYATSRGMQYSFKGVFDESSTQQEVFSTAGLPLVRDLLQGKNGLLFTYGVTGSGKTHTMQGSLEDGGVMTRAIDVLFNSIGQYQVGRKLLLVTDRSNGFQVQSEEDAKIRQQEEMIQNSKYNTRNQNTSNPKLTGRTMDGTTVEAGVDPERRYAVFVSYVEIYNKYVYDLLDESRNQQGKANFTSKNIIEDNYGSMYVHDAKEVEVRTADEALEAFYRGQKRRRVAETQLNHQSSRSHSVFNIRLVCVSTKDKRGMDIDPDGQVMVSQLALVDLAGSERTSRTGNVGDRLREAGNINNSLMNLRMCLEKLRDQQRTGKTQAVPYRNDKMTHLFRNYFEGIGAVKMIVCVNPRVADYDETANVLNFAEMAQEIEIERVELAERDLALTTPARARANQAYQDALARAATTADPSKLNSAYAPIYSLGPAWPTLDDSMFDDAGEGEDALTALDRYLEQRIATRNSLVEDNKEKSAHFRQRLVETETELTLLRKENQQLKAGWDGEKRRVRDLENRLVNAESANTSLQRRVEAYTEQKVVLENELDEKEIQLHEQKKKATKNIHKLKTQISQENQQQHRRKRSHEQPPPGEDEVDHHHGNRRQSVAEQLGGVGSRIAAMEAKITSKRLRH